MDFDKIKNVVRMMKLSGRENVEASEISEISEEVITLSEKELDSIPREFKTLIENKVHVMDFKNNKLVLKPVTLTAEDKTPPNLNKKSNYEKDGGDAKKTNKKMIDNDLNEEFFEIFENFISNRNEGNPHLPYNREQIEKAENFLKRAKSKLEKATISSNKSKSDTEKDELEKLKSRNNRDSLINRSIKSNLDLQRESAEDAIAFSKKEFSDEEHEEYHGLDDMRSVKVKIPRNITTDINKRISEIEKSIKAYDEKGYNDGAGANSNKNKAIEALENIKTNLSSRDYEGFKEAQLFYLTLMSPITDLFPASVVNFLANGEDVNVVGSNSFDEVKPHKTEIKESNINNVREDKRFRVTYEIVSPESAEMGDAEERGWEDEEGISMTPDTHDTEEGVTAVDNAVEFLKDRGAFYPSQAPTYSGGDVWFSDDGDTDYQTGNEKRLSYHPLGFSEEELEEIYNRVTGKASLSENEMVDGDNQYLTLNDVYDKGQTEVWYMKPEFFRDGTMGYRFLQKQNRLPNPQDLDKTHVLLGKVDESEPEKIYHMMQGEIWSPKGEARTLIRSKGLGHTSMTAGDVVVTPNSGALLVDSFGFTPLKPAGEENMKMESLNESFMYTNKSKFDRYFKNSILPSIIKKYGPNDKPAIRTSYNDHIDSLVKDGSLPKTAVNWTVPESFYKSPKEDKVLEQKTMRDYLIEAKKKRKSNPCWKGYEAIGMKKDDNGNEVPNCVPKNK